MAADWSPELTLNDEVLDADHVELFRRIAVAAEAIHGSLAAGGAAGSGAAVEGAILSLGDGLVAHLAREERMMVLTEYPERQRHHIAHELFMADFARMRTALSQRGPDPVVAEWIATRIPEWLRFHIRVNDAPLAAWLARRTAGADPRRAEPAKRRSGGPDRRS